MLRLPTEMLQPGMILARPITNDRGQVLLGCHVPLTPDYIAILKSKGFASVFVKDNDTEDIIINDLLSQDIRQTAQATLAQVFDFVQHISAGCDARTPSTVAADLHDPGVTTAVRQHEGFKQLEQLVTTILDNLLDNHVLISIAEIRQHHDVFFRHAVSVTAIALMIGKRLHLNRADLEQLGAGCMLHDIGKIFLRPLIQAGSAGSEVPAPALLREHPRLGYELLHLRNPDAVLANQVALEHHERQDGLGYPQGLHGSNKVDRLEHDPQHISLITEIASVADVYDILSAGNPQRPALTPPQIAETMRRLAGTFLNREITTHFLSFLAVLPAGLAIFVRGGRYNAYKGVIVRPNSKQPDRPLIRLLYNPQHSRIMPIEVDLAREMSMNIEAALTL